MRKHTDELLWALQTVNEMVALGIIENTGERRASMLDSLYSAIARTIDTDQAETLQGGDDDR